jgi:hypothetical protein
MNYEQKKQTDCQELGESLLFLRCYKDQNPLHFLVIRVAIYVYYMLQLYFCVKYRHTNLNDRVTPFTSFKEEY